MRGRRREIGVLAAAVAAVVVVIVVPTRGGISFAVSRAGAPASPTRVTLTSGLTSLGVAWAESSGGTLAFTATATSAGRVPGICISTAQRCTIAALDDGVVYDVTVVARSVLSGSSAPSVAVSANVGVPGPPRSVRTSAGVAQATVYWAAPTSSAVGPVTGYVATASPGGDSCSTAGTIVSQPARSCEIPGLTKGSKYKVTVAATNAYGSGAPSKSATVKIT